VYISELYICGLNFSFEKILKSFVEVVAGKTSEEILMNMKTATSFSQEFSYEFFG